MKRFALSVIIGFVSLIYSALALAQINPLSASHALQHLKELQTTGSVLYIAAHPDDENTRLITYFAKAKGYRTAYLSLTRGDGGQNLIGEEVREALGLIRTNELLAARSLDGGEQFFTRANDFGYSKTPEETYNFWDKEKVLADMVWVIRKFRPDIIVTRFSPTLGGTHGHHTASAQLALEAYEAAADATKFPEQLQFVETWQTKRIFWNTSPWFFQRNGMQMNQDSVLNLEIGGYDAVLGVSYNEIAAESRSMHKSQGFGSAKQRGATTEYLQILKGDLPQKDPMHGIVTDWSRVKGSEKFVELLQEIQKNYAPQHPEQSFELVVKTYQELQSLSKNEKQKNPTIERAKQLLAKLIFTTSGLFAEAITETPQISNGDSLRINFNIIKRFDVPLKLTTATLLTETQTKQTSVEHFYTNAYDTELPTNQLQTFTKTVLIENVKESSPYWLADTPTAGMYAVEEQTLRGQPLNLPHIRLGITLKAKYQELEIELPVQYKVTDPVKGERYQPLHQVPKVTVKFLERVVIFPDDKAKKVRLELTSHSDSPVSGTLALRTEKDSPEAIAPEMIYFTPAPKLISFSFIKKGETKTVEIDITPPKGSRQHALVAELKFDRKDSKILNNESELAQTLIKIDYDHIPNQILLPIAKVELIRTTIQISNKRIGYIVGAGDLVPQALQQIGYQVELLEIEKLGAIDLSAYDVIITGVRAFNVHDQLGARLPILHQFVENGGNLIVQYNTSYDLNAEIGVFPFKISRARTTEENATVLFEDPTHPVLNTPNKITDADFQHWTQERGLYFASEWDSRYATPLSMHDSGESPQKGSLLIAKYGKGNFIYTGLSWFRQLPAGVEGAYRLFANLIELE